MNQVFLVLGCNLGDKFKNLELALLAIENSLGVIEKKSSIYSTKAWGEKSQPDFLNVVVEVLTDDSAKEVLIKIQKIETDLGRIRIEKWGSRTMDIDILYYNNQILESERLTIPHLLMAERKFVLMPLAEIAVDFIHPVLKKTSKQLLLDCKDDLEVRKLNNILQ